MKRLNFLGVAISTMFILGPSLQAHAQVKYPDNEWAEFSNPVKTRFTKMRSLLGRDQKCKIAIHGQLLKFYKELENEYYLPEAVTCVQDIVANEGTLNEQSGCALVSYDLSKARYSPFYNAYFPRPMVSKLCDSGGFEELMAKKGFWSPVAGQNTSVEDAIFIGQIVSEPWRFVLIYAQSQKLVDWFVAAQKRGDARHAKDVQEYDKEKERKLAAEKKEQEKQRLEEQRAKVKQKARQQQERDRQKKIEEFYE